MHAYLNVWVDVCVYLKMYVWVYVWCARVMWNAWMIHAFMYTFVRTYLYVYHGLYVHMNKWMYMYVSTCVCMKCACISLEWRMPSCIHYVRICMYVMVCMYTWINGCTCMYEFLYDMQGVMKCLHVFMYTFCTYVSVCMSWFVCTHEEMDVHVCMSLCMSVCMICKVLWNACMMHAFMYTFVRTYLYVCHCLYVHMNEWRYMHVSKCVCMNCACISIMQKYIWRKRVFPFDLWINIYIYIYIYIYIHIYSHMYIYICHRHHLHTMAATNIHACT
jgi:hypothetical protein